MKKLILSAMIICTTGLASAQNIPSVADMEKESNTTLAQQYAKSPLLVKGIVTYTGPDPYGLPSIYLHEKEDKNGMYVMCVLPFGNFFNLGDIRNGQELTVSGEFRRKHDEGGFLLLKQCSAVK